MVTSQNELRLHSKIKNRAEAGRHLGQQLLALRLDKPIVFAVPKGGLPVAREISQALGTSLDVVPEASIESRESLEFASVTADQELKTLPGYDDIAERSVIIVDDLIANGAAALSAIKTLKKFGAVRIVVATPIISDSAKEKLLAVEDVEVSAIFVLEETPSVADVYKEDGDLASDDEVRSVSTEARRQMMEIGSSVTEWVDIHIAEGTQVARWRAPQTIRGVALVINTEGDFHRSAEVVEEVSSQLEAAGIGVLSFTMVEFLEDVEAFSQKVRHLTDWLQSYPRAEGLPIAYFGLGIGGAAMIEAAAGTPERVKALVCYETPLKLVEDYLPRVHAPTLFVIENDFSENREANRKAYEELLVEKSLCVLSHASGIGAAIEPWIERFLASTGAFKKSRASSTAERSPNI